MKNKITSNEIDSDVIIQKQKSSHLNDINHCRISSLNIEQKTSQDNKKDLAEVLFITSYPPRECGIATYSQDLIKAFNNKFSNSLSLKVCALESNGITYPYPVEVKYILKTSLAKDYEKLALRIISKIYINFI